MIKIASVQCNVVFGVPEANACRAVEDLAELKRNGVDLAVYPEAYLTGYCVDSPQAAEAIAIRVDSEPIEMVRKACDDLDIMCVLGFAESGEALGSGLKPLDTDSEASESPTPKAESPQLYNTAAIFEPATPPRVSRQSHLPALGL